MAGCSYELCIVLAILLFGVLTQAHSAPNIVVTSSKNEGRGIRYFYTVSGWSTEDPKRTFYGDTDFGTGCVITAKAF